MTPEISVPPIDPTRSELVLPPPGDTPGYWVGAPSALLVDGTYYLAYRLRAPENAGRGWANVVARSEDGVHFETLCEVGKEEFGAESLERPALVRAPAGRWRLYVSCATPGTKHWRVDMLEAADPASFDATAAVTVLTGSDALGVKDPVIRLDGAGWHLWASVHPLERWDDADRMTTEYATSTDGVDWIWQGTALAPRSGEWDARGVRISTVFDAPGGSARCAFYDGRASAGENWEERTGFATQLPGGSTFSADTEWLAQSPHAPHGLRYVDAVPLADGTFRLYYEMTRADGSHELRTELWSALSR